MHFNILIRNFYFITFFMLIPTKSYAQQIIPFTFYFKEGQYELSSNLTISLRNALDKIKTYKIDILGRCDIHGDNALNDSLSYNRAKAVSDFLIANGYPPEKINLVAGLGKRSLLEPDSPFTDSLNRVVWIMEVPGSSDKTTEKIKSYVIRDSVVILSPPYDPRYVSTYSSPQKGDTIHIETIQKKINDDLYTTRVIYIAGGISGETSNNHITSYSHTDTAIHVFPPFDALYLIHITKPRKGDTLKIDTGFVTKENVLFITRTIYIADDSTRIAHSSTPKEISAKTKASALSKVLFDTLSNSAIGDAIILRGLTFEFGYHVMPVSDLPSLQSLKAAFDQSPDLKMEIQGHLCCGEIGKEGYDKQTSQYDLSFNRAKEVYDYLIKLGVDQIRLKYKGYGMQQPLVAIETDKRDQYRNRRIQFLILDK